MKDPVLSVEGSQIVLSIYPWECRVICELNMYLDARYRYRYSKVVAVLDFPCLHVPNDGQLTLLLALGA